MARNSNAGNHPSYDKRKMTKYQIEKKKKYDTIYHKSSRSIKYRSALNKKNRDAGTYGNGDGKDVSHTSNGKKTKMESQSLNRARNRPNVRQTKPNNR